MENNIQLDRETEGNNNRKSADVLIVGAGLAGLTAAVYLARAGKSVIITEQSTNIGGRARTSVHDGYYFNQGPHALYLSGPAVKILQELGIKYHGEPPREYVAIKDDKIQPLPGSMYSILSTKLLTIPSKIEAIRFLGRLNRINTSELDNVSLIDWMNRAIHHQDLADLLYTYFRVTSYTNDPKLASAGSILEQFKMAISGGVVYIDSGWQTLVNGLRDAALDANVQIISGRKAAAVEEQQQMDKRESWIVRFSDASQISASSLVIAAGPSDAYKLFSNENRPEIIAKAAKQAIPVRAAVLDVALSKLPRPDRMVALGIDKPLYLSVHSAFANLAPSNGALIHVMKYLGSSMESSSASSKSELEGLLDLVQPGWRDVLVKKRFLPNMVVSNALVTASQYGTRGRPSVRVAGADNLYIIGDWTGPEGMLLDASLSSAKRAAKHILANPQLEPLTVNAA